MSYRTRFWHLHTVVYSETRFDLLINTIMNRVQHVSLIHITQGS